MTELVLPDLSGDLPRVQPADPTTMPELFVTLFDEVATLWLNRPAKRNAITHAMWLGIGDICEGLAARAEDRGDVRALVVRGIGDHFCAGADISGLVEMPMEQYHRANDRADAALAAFPFPTLAWITGSCVGGGMEIAASCDLRVADDTAVFGITPAKLGVLYPAQALARVTRLIGPSAAKHLFFTGEIIKAERALRIGLVDEVHEPTAALLRLGELMLLFTERSLLSQMGSKAMIDAVSEQGSVPADLERHWLDALHLSPDLAEGIAAFTERRSPQFTWRP